MRSSRLVRTGRAGRCQIRENVLHGVMPSASFDDLDELIGWEARLEEHIQGDSPPTRRDDSLFVLGAIVRMREYTHATKLNNLPGDGIAKRGLGPPSRFRPTVAVFAGALASRARAIFASDHPFRRYRARARSM